MSGLVVPGLIADGCDGRRVEQHEREEDPGEVQAEREAEEAEEQRPAGDERLAALALLVYRSLHLIQPVPILSKKEQRRGSREAFVGLAPYDNGRRPRCRSRRRGWRR